MLQLPQKMQICFDEYDQEAYEEEEEERSEIIEEGEDVEEEEEEKKGLDEEDEDVDRLFYDTDEKLNNTSEEYFRGENIPR